MTSARRHYKWFSVGGFTNQVGWWSIVIQPYILELVEGKIQTGNLYILVKKNSNTWGGPIHFLT
jgi:hypothetical protein